MLNFSKIDSCNIKLNRTVLDLFETMQETAKKYTALPDNKTLSVSNQAELKQLWQTYFRKDKSRTQKGNGLGLSVVKSILDLHETKYYVEMNAQRIVFSIVFPSSNS